MTPEAPSSTMICRLKVPLPEGAWMREFSVAHPEFTVEILSHVSSGRQETTVDLRVLGEGTGSLGPEISGYTGVREVELVETGPSATEYRVVHSTANLLGGLAKLHLMPRLPFLIREGQATWVVVASEAKIRTLYGHLRETTPGVTIESLRHGGQGAELSMLTRRQREIFGYAMSNGYYEVPRRVSLTELAETLGLAKSTLSESLATIERKILKDVMETSTRFQ